MIDGVPFTGEGTLVRKASGCEQKKPEVRAAREQSFWPPFETGSRSTLRSQFS